MKTQVIPNQSKPSGKGALAKYKHPRRHPKTPTLAAHVWALVEGKTAAK